MGFPPEEGGTAAIVQLDQELIAAPLGLEFAFRTPGNLTDRGANGLVRS
jgi:hypothetical protein